MESQNRVYRLLTAVCMVVILFSGIGLAQTIPQGAMVRINNTYIMTEDFDLMTQRHIEHYRNMYGLDLESPEMIQYLYQLKDMVLQQMMVNELLFAIQEEENLQVTQEDIGREAQEIREHYPDDASFAMVLEDAGYTMDEFMRDMTIQAILRKLEEKLIADVEITTEDLVTYYQSNPELFGGEPEQIHAAHILVDTREEAEKIYGALMDGESFSAMASQYSQCPSSASGGDLGFFTRGQMVLAFEEAAFNLEVGALSEPVKTDFGYHLIMLKDRIEALEYSFEDIEDKVNIHYQDQLKMELVNSFLDKALMEADVEVYHHGF